MQIGLWILKTIFFWLVLTVLFRIGVRRGGRLVQFIDPQDLLIYPDVTASLPKSQKRDLRHKSESFLMMERFIPLEGTVNFRDLGGYLTQDGRHVRWGQLFRSDEFSQITDKDLVTLTRLNLQNIIDLRNPFEIKGKENRLPSNCTYHQIRIYKNEPIMDYLWVALFQRHRLAEALGGNYIKLTETRAQAFGTALRFLADPKNLPLVYHCSAGKDRTGIVSALTLALLGVPDPVIIADYSLSNLGFEHYYTEFLTERKLDRWGIPPEEFQAVFIVEPDWMQNLLNHLKGNYGSVTGFLERKAGLEPWELERIRENLLAR